MPDLSFLGPAAASVIIVFLFLKFMRDEATRRDKSDEKLITALDNLKDQSKETHAFLVNLNGSLKRTVKAKQKQARE